MPGPAASATSVGAGSPRGGGGSSPRAGENHSKNPKVAYSLLLQTIPEKTNKLCGFQEEEELGSELERHQLRVGEL